MASGQQWHAACLGHAPGGEPAFAYNATTHLSQNLDRRDKRNCSQLSSAEQQSKYGMNRMHSLSYPFISSFIHSFTRLPADRLSQLTPPFRSIAAAIAAVAAGPAPLRCLASCPSLSLSLHLSLFLFFSCTLAPRSHAAVVAALSLTHSHCSALSCALSRRPSLSAFLARFECVLSATWCVFRTA